MTTITEQLDRLQALCDKATSGPWRLTGFAWNPLTASHNAVILTMKAKGNFGSERSIGRLCMNERWSDPAFPDERGNDCWELPMQANADLMIIAPQAMPKLIAALRLAMEAIDWEALHESAVCREAQTRIQQLLEKT